MKPTVKAFHDDIGVLNELNRLTSQGVPKETLHLFAHDEQRTDRLIGDAAGADLGHVEDLVIERYNEEGDELREIFRGFGFDADETDGLENRLDAGAILLLIEQPQASVE
jgi:hypothetical protein